VTVDGMKCVDGNASVDLPANGIAVIEFSREIRL